MLEARAKHLFDVTFLDFHTRPGGRGKFLRFFPPVALVAGRDSSLRGSHKLLSLGLNVQPRVLVRFGPSERSNALNKVKDAFWYTALFFQYRFDNFADVRF